MSLFDRSQRNRSGNETSFVMTSRPIWQTSGDVLPRILLDKLQRYPPDDAPADLLSTLLSFAIRESNGSPSRASQLESIIQRVNQELEGIQKQIQRGEEVYYEDTYGFGSLFTGFDGVLDARGDNSYSGSNTALRRMPNDARWFSLPLHLYTPLPPPAITNDVPVTVEAPGAAQAIASSSPSPPAKQRTAAATATAATSPKKDERMPRKEERPPKKDESEPDESEEEAEEKEEEVKGKAEARETRSKRKAAAPPPVRRTKRKRR